MHRHFEPDRGHWAMAHRRRYGGHGFGRYGRGGGEMGPEDLRAGRMLAQGDLRLIALTLIAEEPRHGYEIIKELEDRFRGAYAPSPGTVYPTLTMLEDLGYAKATLEEAASASTKSRLKDAPIWPRTSRPWRISSSGFPISARAFSGRR